MCQFKSGLILKDRVFVPDYDSHQDILSELKIKDNRKNAENLFVRAELIPKDGDAFSDPETWSFNIDQDIVPEWFVKDYEKQRMIAAVKEWAATHIFDGVDGLELSCGSGYYIRNCKDVVICGSATVENIYGSATVENICGSATVKNICGSATVENICGSATVENIYGSATVENIYGSATVENIYGSATVKNICDSATVKNIYGSATVKNIYDSATVENIYGSATVENIYGSATVENICGSATVKNICGSATVKNICDSATVKNIYGSATVKNIYDSATVENIYDSATVKYAKGYSTIIGSKYGWDKKSLIICENATFKDCKEKVIYQSGDWKFVEVKSE